MADSGYLALFVCTSILLLPLMVRWPFTHCFLIWAAQYTVKIWELVVKIFQEICHFGNLKSSLLDMTVQCLKYFPCNLFIWQTPLLSVSSARVTQMRKWMRRHRPVLWIFLMILCWSHPRLCLMIRCPYLCLRGKLYYCVFWGYSCFTLEVYDTFLPVHFI